MLSRISLLSVFTVFLLSSCSYTQSYQGEKATYETWLEDNVKVERLFVRGEQRLAMKFLAVNSELIRLQSEVAPGFEFPIDAKKFQYIVAVSSQNKRPFTMDELKFSIDGRVSEDVRELTSMFTIQTLYPYADPYYRVFYVGFERPQASDSAQSPEIFRIQTARGSISLPLSY